MNAQRLSFGFALYGLFLLAAAIFCFWVNSYFHAAWLGIAGFGIMTWAHFFNRKHYWGFRALLAQLFILCGTIGWQVLTFFQAQTSFTNGKLTITGFHFFSALFLVTVSLLLLATKKAAQIQEELR